MAGCEAAGCVGVVGVRAHAAANATQTQTLTTADTNDTDLFFTHFKRRAFALSREGLPAAASAEWRQRADALPPSSRDTGNRISFDGLRGFAETRDSEGRRVRAESRVQSISLEAVSPIPGPCPSSRPQPAIPRDARRRRAGACGATRRSSSAGARAEACGRRRRASESRTGHQGRADGQVSYRQPRCERYSEGRPSSELTAVWSEPRKLMMIGPSACAPRGSPRQVRASESATSR